MIVLNDKERKNSKIAVYEQYIVKFWIVNSSGFTEQKEEMYHVVNSRKAHKQVEAKWRKDFPSGKLISVIYC